MADWLGGVNPTVTVQELSSVIAGTDLAAYLHFSDSADRYRESFVQAMNADQANHGLKAGYMADRSVFASVPAFEYQPISFGAVLRSHTPSFLLLLLQITLAVFLFATSVRNLRLL